MSDNLKSDSKHSNQLICQNCDQSNSDSEKTNGTYQQSSYGEEKTFENLETQVNEQQLESEFGCPIYDSGNVNIFDPLYDSIEICEDNVGWRTIKQGRNYAMMQGGINLLKQFREISISNRFAILGEQQEDED